MFVGSEVGIYSYFLYLYLGTERPYWRHIFIVYYYCMPTWGECRSTFNVHPYVKILAERTWKGGCHLMSLVTTGRTSRRRHSQWWIGFICFTLKHLSNSPFNWYGITTMMVWSFFFWRGAPTYCYFQGRFLLRGVFRQLSGARPWMVCFWNKPSIKGNVNVNVCFIRGVPF